MKLSILDVWQGSECATAGCKKAVFCSTEMLRKIVTDNLSENSLAHISLSETDDFRRSGFNQDKQHGQYSNQELHGEQVNNM